MYSFILENDYKLVVIKKTGLDICLCPSFPFLEILDIVAYCLKNSLKSHLNISVRAISILTCGLFLPFSTLLKTPVVTTSQRNYYSAN